MHCTAPFTIAALTVFALTAARGQEAASPAPAGAPAEQACLDQKEQLAAIESGKVVHLAVAMRAAKKRMPGTVVRARLCHGKDGLVYVLTILARDGKVARLTVDALRGSLVGER
jgi:uncharacterized membrane protein YkoI